MHSAVDAFRSLAMLRAFHAAKIDHLEDPNVPLMPSRKVVTGEYFWRAYEKHGVIKKGSKGKRKSRRRNARKQLRKLGLKP